MSFSISSIVKFIIQSLKRYFIILIFVCRFAVISSNFNFTDNIAVKCEARVYYSLGFLYSFCFYLRSKLTIKPILKVMNVFAKVPQLIRKLGPIVFFNPMAFLLTISMPTLIFSFVFFICFFHLLCGSHVFLQLFNQLRIVVSAILN